MIYRLFEFKLTLRLIGAVVVVVMDFVVPVDVGSFIK